ncbi:MAG: hypothetical protein RJQ21_15705 [Rhodospirillales bacterium]
MLCRFTRFARSFGLAGAALAAAACSSTGFPAHAQTQDNIPVIVMPEDSDPRTVKRSSDINKRVIAELKDSMLRHGFRMVDEEAIASRLGWKVLDRRPKTQLFEAAGLANSAGQANLRSRALALYRVHARLQDVDYAKKLETRIDGELYDLDNNTFIGNFSLPPATYPAPADCNATCISDIVGGKAAEIAASIGDVLGAKLAYLSPGSGQAAGGGSVEAATVDQGSGTDPRCRNMVSAFTIVFKRFEQNEISHVMGAMTNNASDIVEADRFPCFVSSDLMDNKPAIARYSYTSTATRGKLNEWLNIILLDMGLTPNREVAVIQPQNSNDIILDKLITRTPPMQQVPAGSRFN